MKFEIHGSGGVLARWIDSDAAETGEDALLAHARRSENYKAETGELYYFPSLTGPGTLLIGLGQRKKLTAGDLRDTFYKAGRLLNDRGETELTLHVPPLAGLAPEQLAEVIAEGLLHAAYRFDYYKSDAKPVRPLTVHYCPEDGDLEAAARGIDRAEQLMAGVFLARDLVNEPANIIYPETLADRAAEALRPLGVDVQIHDRAAVEKLGMKAFLTVSRGSAREPRLIVMTYTGDPASHERTALVGKGLTYDSGGYSIKPTDSMATMFCDMGGAGTVIGAMRVLAALKAKVNVTGIVAACENMISGDAYRPGDIIESMSGKTIEIVNTDAEGRLTLADAVYYATAKEHLNCDRVIDLATLTGACVVALGEIYTGAMTNDGAFLNQLKTAAGRAGEKVWELPADPDFARMNDSKLADLKNLGGRWGGTISAGLFVGAFVAGDKPWIHLDIAGTAYLEKAAHHLPAGATGVMVKTLAALLTA